eukprot:313878-Pyramimonas_sp.AAC.1
MSLIFSICAFGSRHQQQRTNSVTGNSTRHRALHRSSYRGHVQPHIACSSGDGAEETLLKEGYRAKRPGWRKKYLRFLPYEEAHKTALSLGFNSK